MAYSKEGVADEENGSGGPIYAGQNTSFACKAFGSHPAPKVTWWIDDTFELDNHSEVRNQYAVKSVEQGLPK